MTALAMSRTPRSRALPLAAAFMAGLTATRAATSAMNGLEGIG